MTEVDLEGLFDLFLNKEINNWYITPGLHLNQFLANIFSF